MKCCELGFRKLSKQNKMILAEAVANTECYNAGYDKPTVTASSILYLFRVFDDAQKTGDYHHDVFRPTHTRVYPKTYTIEQ